ncbi:hypothetical protein [Halegenticoccus soli]|uniref:hypothetical protein n=1 Tax=Halegenticoccus soli TaxID=1985678 RepID=UPI000C6CF5A2|nr:hypothetical protein [Halegenticoccus soli]
MNGKTKLLVAVGLLAVALTAIGFVVSRRDWAADDADGRDAAADGDDSDGGEETTDGSEDSAGTRVAEGAEA